MTHAEASSLIPGDRVYINTNYIIHACAGEERIFVKYEPQYGQIQTYDSTYGLTKLTYLLDDVDVLPPPGFVLKTLAQQMIDEVGSKMAGAFKSKLDYPHKCPKCGGRAFIGFSSIDCERKCG